MISLARRLKQLATAIPECMLGDQRRLRWRLRNLRRGNDIDLVARLESDIVESRARRERRLALRPIPCFDDSLPVSQRRAEIARAITDHPVVIVCGETGSGKTTQLPKICLDLGRGVSGMIGHTQPRRIAARSIAGRIASELKGTVGHAVGYKVRFSDRVSPDTYVKLMTDGILLAETQSDRFLVAYDTLIIDEAHERSLNIDFLLGYLKRLLSRRRDLKLIITSATIDTERFSRHFDDAPVIEVCGRSYPVEIGYRPLLAADEDGRERDRCQAILDAIDEVSALGAGDVLVFLPGEREIRETAEALRKHHPPHTEVLPLFSRLSSAEQNRIFHPHTGRRIVLATNVAETSLTVPGIRYVIDTGLARISRVSRRAKIQRLPIERISRSSANQRAGRCGRLGPGVCIRLYDEQDFLSRPPFTDPEILRTNLAAAILRMKALDLGDALRFPFLDPPTPRQIGDGFKLLEELGAVDALSNLTELGLRLARLPVDPRIGRMILAAKDLNCLTEVLVIASALSVQDPRERPLHAQQAADQAHQCFRDERSDFLSYLMLWEVFQDKSRHLSQNKLRNYCRENFLSYVRLQEWRDIHRQLSSTLRDMGLHPSESPAEYPEIHRALLTGLLGNIAFNTEPGHYTGAHGMKLQIFPGSALYKKNPKWIVAAEVVETTRPYARCVAKIDPDWIEPLAGHLVKRNYFEPHWEKKPAQVAAYQHVSLYGLNIVVRRKVNYGPVNPKEAREIFIREGLVHGELNTKARFLEHNREMTASVEALEHKSRRRDVLVDEDTLFQFYDTRIPAEIFSGADFDRWRASAEREDPRLLFLSREALMRHDAAEITAERFPDHLRVDGVRLPLSYHFEPGHPDDGVTLTLPLAALNQIDAERLDWLVPGLLREKLLFLIKSLPKQLRRHFVPAPEFAEACWQALDPGMGGLLPAVASALHRMTGVAVPSDGWAHMDLPGHLRMNVRLVDDSRKLVVQGRDLEALRKSWAGQAECSFRQLPDIGIERTGLKDWDFEQLPERVDLRRDGLTLQGYPALVDRGTAVDLVLADAPDKAARVTYAGLRRLVMLKLPDQVKYLRKHLPDLRKMCLYYDNVPPSPWEGAPDTSTSSPCEQLAEDLVCAGVDRTFIHNQSLIRSRAEFEARCERGRAELVGTSAALCQCVAEVLVEHHDIASRLMGKIPLAWVPAVSDIRSQLKHLVYRGFVVGTPPQWLERLPRYLRAIRSRLDRLKVDPARDRERMCLVAARWESCSSRLAQNYGEERFDPELETYRWMLEEFRISVFAQELKTLFPISASRLDQQWRKIRSG